MNEPFPAATKPKIVLLARDTVSASILYNYVSKDIEFAGIIMENPITNWEMFRKRVRRIGLVKAVSQVCFIVFIAKPQSLFSRKRRKAILEKYKLDITPINRSLITWVSSVNAEDCRAVLQKIQPDLVLVNGTRIISTKTLSCINARFINIHDGITPAYRGVHGGYWAMATGHPDLFGTTIHFVDKGIDTGTIIRQVFTVPEAADNFSTYPLLQHAIALPAVTEILKSFLSGAPIPIQEPVCENSPVRFHPSVMEWLKNRKRSLSLLFLLQSVYHFI